MPKKPGTFGPLVIGEERFASEQKIVRRKAHRFGPLVVGKDEDDAPASPAAVTAEVEAKLRELGIDPAKLQEGLASAPETLREIAAKIIGASAPATGAAFTSPAGEDQVQREYTPPAEAPDISPAETDGESEGEGAAEGTEAAPDIAPAVHAEAQATPAETAEKVDADRSGYATIAELLRALNGEKVTVEDAMALEEARDPSSQRKGAYQAILAKEMQRDGGARAEVQARVEAALSKLG